MAPFFDLMIDTQLLKQRNQENSGSVNTKSPAHANIQFFKMRFIIHFFNKVSEIDTHPCNFDLHVIQT